MSSLAEKPLNQPGISRAIGGLEKEWNNSLLEHSRTDVALTSNGIKLRPFVRRVCEEYRKLQSKVDTRNGLHSGVIHISNLFEIAGNHKPDNLFCQRQRQIVLL